MKKPLEVAYLGPEGTFSHLVAEKYFGKTCRMCPEPTILDICQFVSGHSGRKGIIPLENSSGGAIYETVDILLSNRPPIHIEAELALDVKLALLGRRGQEVRTLYSHFAPLEHSAAWIRKHLPRAERKVVTSTAVAARMAFVEDHAAALGNRQLAKLYNLDVLEYPVQQDVPNQTMFLAIAGRKAVLKNCVKTTIAARLPNVPGSLCDFLDAFRSEGVNLSRITSRPIRGCPREYAFLVDMDGTLEKRRVEAALKKARKHAVSLRVVGAYPAHRPYQS